MQSMHDSSTAGGRVANPGTTYRLIVGHLGLMEALRLSGVLLEQARLLGFTFTAPSVSGGIVTFTVNGDGIRVTAPWHGDTYAVNADGGTWTLEPDGAWWHPADGCECLG